MMTEELIRTRCKAGWLVVTEQAIRIERKGILGAGSLSQVMARQSLVSASSENKLPGVFGAGGASTMVFTGYGAALKAELVNPQDANRIMEMLGFA